MSAALLLASGLALMLVAWAAAGPVVLRRAASALCRVPRFAVLFLAATGVLWFSSLMAVALVLAWTAAGPALLPGRAAEVCQRCIESSSPFGSPGGTLLSPAVPLLVAVLLTVLLAARALLHARARWRITAREVAEHLSGAERIELEGHSVHLLDDRQPRAFSLPTLNGGIAVSRGAIEALSPLELRAVLEHEAAHLRQRHHAQVAILQALFAPLAWIPLYRAIVAAVPLYLELAADGSARRCCGTDALASALLRMGTVPKCAEVPGVALHAAGPDRVRHLVAPAPVRRGLPALGVGIGQLAVAGVVSVVVVTTYLTTFVAGCAI